MAGTDGAGMDPQISISEVGSSTSRVGMRSQGEVHKGTEECAKYDISSIAASDFRTEGAGPSPAPDGQQQGVELEHLLALRLTSLLMEMVILNGWGGAFACSRGILYTSSRGGYDR